MKFITCIFIIFFLLSICLTNSNPGIKASVQDSAINYIAKVFLPILEEQIKTTKIPDESGEADKIEYKISSISIKSFSLNSVTTSFSPPNTISFTISAATGSLKADWHYKEKKIWPYISDSGNLDADIGTNIIFKISIIVDPTTQKPKIVINNFDCPIYHFSLTLHGGASWLYNFLIGIFKSNIVKSIESALRSQVPAQIEEIIKEEIKQFPIIVPIGDTKYNLFCDCAFREFSSTEKWMTFGLKGEVFQNGTEIPPFEPKIYPDYDPSYSNEMLQVLISDYILGAVGFVAGKSKNLLFSEITKDNAPSQIKYFFNTTFYQFLIPQLYTKYPNREIQVMVFPGDAIKVNMTKQNGIKMFSEIDLGFNVILDGGKKETAFTLAMFLGFDLSVSLITSNTTLTGKITLENLNIKIKQSSIGDFDVKILNDLIYHVVNDFLIPIANSFAQKGFALPSTKGLVLVDPKLEIRDGYIFIGSSFTYTPQKIRKIGK